METTRKAWSSPQVFVLGAEGTNAKQAGGTNEGQFHLEAQNVHLEIPESSSVEVGGSDNIAFGYES
jgi:hypothetical protein